MAYSRGGDIEPILNVVRAHLDHLNAILCRLFAVQVIAEDQPISASGAGWMV